MAKGKLNRDQKRKTKLKERSRKLRESPAAITPYTGQTYHTDYWTGIIFEMEAGIFWAIRQAGHRLTNRHAETAFKALILSLRDGEPAVTAESAAPPTYTAGQEVSFLMATIRQRWAVLFDKGQRIATADLIGILRTLLHSIEAQAWDRGSKRGYLDFIEHFIGESLGTGAAIAASGLR